MSSIQKIKLKIVLWLNVNLQSKKAISPSIKEWISSHIKVEMKKKKNVYKTILRFFLNI